jgi:protein SCO1/2
MNWSGNRAAFSLALVLSVGVLSAVGCRSKAPPVLGEVPAFSLTDHAGRAFTERTLKGQVWAAAFVFTRCPTACPRVTSAMRAVQSTAREKGVQLALVSYTVDPEFDTPEVLSRYAKEHAADLRSWWFVTGDASAIQAVAERGFKIGVDGKIDPTKPDFGLTHGTHLVLVDPSGKIRGYYSTSVDAALTALVDDAARLGR